MDISIPRDVCQQQKKPIPLNRSMVKAYNWRELRLYAIASAEFSGRGGWFTLAALMDALQERYGARTLHHRPGNNRRRTGKALTALLVASPLFCSRGNAFQAISWRKASSRESARTPLRLEDLRGERAFNDYCLAALIQGQHIPAFSACRDAGISRGAFYQSLGRLERAGRIIKIKQHAISEAMGLDEARRCQRALKAAGTDTSIIKGRARPAAFSPWGRTTNAGRPLYYLAYHMQNHYLLGDSAGTKDRRALPFKKAACWYTPIDSKGFEVSHNTRLYTFSAAYSEDAYIQDHSRLYAAA